MKTPLLISIIHNCYITSKFNVLFILSLTKIQAVNFIKFNDSVNIKLCKINNEKEFICDEINSKVCLMKIPKTKTDIGSEIIGKINYIY